MGKWADVQMCKCADVQMFSVPMCKTVCVLRIVNKPLHQQIFPHNPRNFNT